MAQVIRIVDEPPSSYVAPVPRSRWHLLHRYVVVRVDARTTYVGCATCGRPRTPTLFEPPVP